MVMIQILLQSSILSRNLDDTKFKLQNYTFKMEVQNLKDNSQRD